MLIKAKEAYGISINNRQRIANEVLDDLKDLLIKRITRHYERGELKLNHHIRFIYSAEDIIEKELNKLGEYFKEKGYSFTFEFDGNGYWTSANINISWEG